MKSALKNKIRETIQNEMDGSISFSKFMDMCLYDSDDGYYSSQFNQFGKHGDFYTAPMLGQTFAITLTKQIEQCFSEVRENILEIGAGNAQLAIDVILNLYERNIYLDNYYILEKSQELKQYQLQALQDKLPIELFKKITWVEEFIDQFNGVIIANELFDAIPTDVFSSFENEIMEKKVRADNQNFSWTLSENKKQFDYQLSLGDGAFDFEYSPGYHKIFTDFVRAEQMVCFIFDYGMDERQLFHSSRPHGTLRGFKKNLLTEIFENIGEQDITYHVNFTHLAFLAQKFNLNILGYTHQSHFLNNLGLEIEDTNEIKDHLKLLSDINLLTSPAEMGELIKVMAISKNCQSSLNGFLNFDKTHLL